MPPVEGGYFADADLFGRGAKAFVFVHGQEVILHFLFVVYPVERGVDGFFECTPAFLTTIALDAEVFAVSVECAAIAAWARKSREACCECED